MSTTSVGETTRLTALARIMRAEEIPLETARYLMGLVFPQRDIDRMNALAQKSQQGDLTPAEKTEIDGYCEANDLLGLLQSRARMALNRQDQLPQKPM